MIYRAANINELTQEIEIKFTSRNKNEFFAELTKIKSLPHRTFNKKKKLWVTPITKEITDQLNKWGYIIQEPEDDSDDNWTAPWLDQTFTKPVPEYLRPYQVETMKFLKYLNGRGLIADDMGCLTGDVCIPIYREFEDREVYESMYLEDLYNLFRKDRKVKISTLSYSDKTQQLLWNPIRNIVCQGYKRVIKIITDNRIIKGTTDHPILIDNNTFKPMGSIIVGDRIVCRETGVKIKSELVIGKECIFEKQLVYDIIMTDPYRNFIANGIVVHNSGKTVQALGFMDMSKQLPALIVVPATIKQQWVNQFHKFLDPDCKLAIKILSGQTPYPLEEDTTYVINWDILQYWLPELLKVKFKNLVGDEIHRIANKKARRTKAFKTLAKKIPYLQALSGTPIKSRPRQFFNILNILAPEVFDDEWKYLNRYCDPKSNGFGLTFDGSSNLKELHKKVRNFMIRRTKDEIMPWLPEKQYSVIPLEVDLSSNYYLDSLERFKEATGLKKQEEFSNMKLEVFGLKQDFVIKWIRDFLDDGGKKLLVGTYHRKVIEYLKSEFPKNSVCIYGGIGNAKREDVIKQFIENDKIQILFGQILSAGEGIDGLQEVCSDVAFVELANNPTDHLQFEDRLHRGDQKHTVNVNYLVAAGTIEEDIVESLNTKKEVLDKLLNGEMEGTINFIDFLKKENK